MRFLFALIAFAAALAHAQPWPAKPIRFIIAGAVGAPPDLVARALAQPLQQVLGQPFVVDNRPGANGIIGIEAVIRSPADGHTLLATQGAAISLNPYFYAKLPYEPLRDLAPVFNGGVISAGIFSSAAHPANTMRELVEAARAKPDTLVWATWGSGTFSDLYRAWAENAFGVKFREVPYKTPDQAATAVITDEAQVLLNIPTLMAPQVRAGKMKALATIGPKRSALLPDVPSFAELGYDIDFRGFVGIFAPAGTPRDIIVRLNAEMAKIAADPEFQSRHLARASVEARIGSPEEFAAFLKTDREVAGRLAKLANVKPQ